jgi:uncharacterized protein
MRHVAALAAVLLICQVPFCHAGDRLTAIELGKVKVAGEIGRRIEVTVRNNLLALDADKDFLPQFASKDKADGYIGLGKLIDSAVRLAAYTGDAQAVKLKKHLVEEALRYQQPDGYLGLIKADNRIWALWDVHELSYLVYGLTADYRYFHEKASLDAARRAADYIIRVWTADPERKPGNGQITVHMAVTGVESAMLALYEQTQDKKYLDFASKFRNLPGWEDHIVLGRWGQIEGHAYAHMCRCVAQLRLNRLQPDPRLSGPAHRVIDFLTRGDGLAITGACGDHECWHDTQSGTINLGETCATAYLIRLLDELLRIEGDPRYGDLMERSIYNALFAAQSPDGRQIRYYSPLDGPRAYFKGDTYCCPCNYRRIVAELPGLLYYRTSEGGLAVNLYAASTAQVELAEGLTAQVRQVTEYPRAGQVKLELTLSKPWQFPVQMRIPKWCQKPTVRVNGQNVPERAKPEGWLTIERLWKTGDQVTLDLPMPWRLVKGRKAQAGRVAIMRGPMLYCLSRKGNAKLEKMDLRLITIDPKSIEGPVSSQIIPGGKACTVKAWGPGTWYPMAKPDLTLTLAEFADPDGEAVFFNVPNPIDPALVDDELIAK